MADFSLLLNHPDRDEIISKLISGSSPKEIYQWLKLKYPGKDQGHLRLAQKLLKEFSESPYLTDYYGKFKSDLAKVSSENDPKVRRGLAESILNNKTYQERVLEIADKELDWNKMLENMIATCMQRFEQVFDTIQNDPTKFKGDNYLLRYIDSLTSAIERLKKMQLIEDAQSLNQNITAQALEEQTAFLQEVIRDVLAEIDPDTAMLFLEKFNEKMETVKPPAPLSQDARIKETEIIEAKLIEGPEDKDDNESEKD